MKGAYRTSSGKWQSKINIKGKPVHLGVFPTAKQASDAYLAMRAKYPAIIRGRPAHSVAKEMDAEVRRRSMLPLQEREQLVPAIDPDLLDVLISRVPGRTPQGRERIYNDT